jgi:hypothetical protein
MYGEDISFAGTGPPVKKIIFFSLKNNNKILSGE